jgi:tetratricopeptide (TPR) repeat protein
MNACQRAITSLIILIGGLAYGDPAIDYYNRGVRKQEKGDLDGAIADCTKAIELDPRDAESHVNRASAKRRKGDLEGALADCTQALELNPKLIEAYFVRAEVKSDKGDLDGTIGDYDEALKLQPDISEVYVNRGAAKAEKRDLDGAIADYTKAIQLKPDYVVAYFNRGFARYRKGNYKRSLADYTKAIELKPDLTMAYQGRGDLHYELGAFTNALADYRKACDLSPSKDYVRILVYLLRARLGEKQAASDELKQHLDSRKASKPDGWVTQIGNLLTGELNEKDFIKAAETADKLSQAWLYAGTKHFIAGNKAAAKEYFLKCLATAKEDSTEYKRAAAELKFLGSSE